MISGNEVFYGQQQTDKWHNLRLGLFTSSIIYHLFEDSSKQAKATALMQQLKEGIWQPTHEVLNYRPSTNEITYISKYLVDFRFIKALDLPYLKKDLKAVLKGGSFSVSDHTKDCLLILTACYALRKIEISSGSADMLCKKKALELIYEAPDEELTGVRSLDWGNEGEGLARHNFEVETMELLDNGKNKISFIRNESLQTGSSPDDTINGITPVEYKNPINKGIHYDHCKILTAEQLLAFDRQKYFQLQHQTWVLGAAKGYFVSFDRRLLNSEKYKHKAIHILEVPRNEKIMQQFEPRLLQAIEIRNKFIEQF